MRVADHRRDSGFIGTQLAAFLSTGGHEVLRIGRGAGGGRQRRTSPGIRSAAQLDPRALEGVDAVIHLAGASIAERWTTARIARRFAASRIEGTSLLAHTLGAAGSQTARAGERLGDRHLWQSRR